MWAAVAICRAPAMEIKGSWAEARLWRRIGKRREKEGKLLRLGIELGALCAQIRAQTTGMDRYW